MVQSNNPTPSHIVINESTRIVSRAYGNVYEKLPVGLPSGTAFRGQRVTAVNVRIFCAFIGEPFGLEENAVENSKKGQSRATVPEYHASRVNACK